MIPRQVQLSKTWKVNLDEAEPSEQAVEENRQLISQGEPHAGLVALSAKALGYDIIALDYSKKPDGSYVFWEVIRNFDLSVGGRMWSQYRRTTERTHEDCVESVRVIGNAIAGWSSSVHTRTECQTPNRASRVNDFTVVAGATKSTTVVVAGD